MINNLVMRDAEEKANEQPEILPKYNHYSLNLNLDNKPRIEHLFCFVTSIRLNQI